MAGVLAVCDDFPPTGCQASNSVSLAQLRTQTFRRAAKYNKK
jgi:hypothetical protein